MKKLFFRFVIPFIIFTIAFSFLFDIWGFGDPCTTCKYTWRGEIEPGLFQSAFTAVIPTIFLGLALSMPISATLTLIGLIFGAILLWFFTQPIPQESGPYSGFNEDLVSFGVFGAFTMAFVAVIIGIIVKKIKK